MSVAISNNAIASKQSQDALAQLESHYRLLTVEERVIVDQLLAEQVRSDDENVRFDALALVDNFKIGSAAPALRGLADWLERQGHPGAPYEWAKVNRILANVTSDDE
jgi:hypothetical protein